MLAADVDDIRPSDRLILWALESDERRLVPQGDLVESTGLPPATVTEALHRLTDRALAERTTDPTDARRKAVTITADPDTSAEEGLDADVDADADADADDVSIPRRPADIEHA